MINTFLNKGFYLKLKNVIETNINSLLNIIISFISSSIIVFLILFTILLTILNEILLSSSTWVMVKNINRVISLNIKKSYLVNHNKNQKFIKNNNLMK